MSAGGAAIAGRAYPFFPASRRSAHATCARVSQLLERRNLGTHEAKENYFVC